MAENMDEEVRQRWDREIALVRLTGACPYCDGPVDRDIMTNPSGDEIVDWQCEDCTEQWIAVLDELDGDLR